MHTLNYLREVLTVPQLEAHVREVAAYLKECETILAARKPPAAESKEVGQ